MSDLIYPARYYHRGGVSDKKFVLDRMACIPPEKQQEVADEFERLYLANGPIHVRQGRYDAKVYLNNIAKAYSTGKLKSEKPSDNLTDYQRHQEKMKQEEQEARKKTSKAVPPPSGVKDKVKKETYTGPSIIEMAEQARDKKRK